MYAVGWTDWFYLNTDIVKNVIVLDCIDQSFAVLNVENSHIVAPILTKDIGDFVKNQVNVDEINGYENNGLRMLILWLWLNETVGFVISVHMT